MHDVACVFADVYAFMHAMYGMSGSVEVSRCCCMCSCNMFAYGCLPCSEVPRGKASNKVKNHGPPIKMCGYIH